MLRDPLAIGVATGSLKVIYGVSGACPGCLPRLSLQAGGGIGRKEAQKVLKYMVFSRFLRPLAANLLAYSGLQPGQQAG
jgi:hypothetical protein